MVVRRVSAITGTEHSMDLNITADQMDAYERGLSVQKAFPQLSAAEREFIMSGITPREWQQYYDHPEFDEDATGLTDQ